MQVLIAEDNALLAFMIEEPLTERGHIVVGRANRYDVAVRLAERRRPDLALIDIDLEGDRSGVELATELKTRLGVQTLFATGQVERARAHREAALGLLEKPFSPAAVVAAVEIVDQIFRGNGSFRAPPELELFSAGPGPSGS